ncbi:putative carrier protein [Trypanosoma vivax]|nr:putative carrier protein [Trypanosoma vivax]
MLLPQYKIRELLSRFDEEGKGGLTKTQWLQFCVKHYKLFASPGNHEGYFSRVADRTVVADEGRSNQVNRAIQCVVHFLEGFAAGGIAGAVSKTIIAPADKIKIIFQVDSQRCFTFRNAAKLGTETVREHGLLGLWMGNGAMMMRVVPYAAVTFASFDYYHEGFKCLLVAGCGVENYNERTAVVMRFLSGSLSGATATACTYPLDLMRARFAVYGRTDKEVLSYLLAYKSLVMKHGWKSLYAGLVPTLAGIMPYAGCSFAVFETLKSYIVRWREHGTENVIQVHERVVAGGLAGLIAQSATYPLDIVRRRMQITPGRYRGVLHALCTIYKEEGFKQGWYRGLSMNWIKGPIAVGTGFTVNDMIKRRMREYDEKVVSCSPRKNAVTVTEALLCGAIAVAVSRVLTLPLDWLLCCGNNGVSILCGLRNQTATTGKGLCSGGCHMWKSGRVTTARLIPYGALTYCSFDVFQSSAARLLYSVTPNPASNFIAGAAAGALATAVAYPLELVHARVVANMLPSNIRSHCKMLCDTVRHRGLFSLWEFYSIAMLGVVPVVGIGFATYGLLREHYNCESFAQRVLVGMTSGFIAQGASYPLNIARQRRNVEYRALNDGPKSLKPVVLRSALGPSFYRRVPFPFCISAITFGISFAINDVCRDAIIGTKKDALQNLIPKKLT